ncbi:hypothetical protein J1N35_024883 [Gossypium stocksii]|uniref:Reverse transcriptase domain-containing protein n=1 Tax=Gossypium stocksii TaxID=47602 RepID=A0A9D3ZVN9_9ROSI|nr:hypothetical protein J1N35_024883 [Gossypium stocksii]
MSSNTTSIFLFIDTNIIRQTKSDHDAVLLDTMGKKPKEKQRDPRLFFRYDTCWAKDKRAKVIIKHSWFNRADNTLEKIYGIRKSSKNDLNKGLVVKIDISKAYDRVEWKFLETVMKNMGFADAWINLIMKCVCSVKYVVKCNRVLTNTIAPERGLR